MRGAVRRTLPLLVAVALSVPFVATAVPAASEWTYCAAVRFDGTAPIRGSDLARCLGLKMGFASGYRTRIAATGDRTTVADVQLDPLRVDARRGTESVRIGATARSNDSLFSIFVRGATPPDQLVRVVRSVDAWRVVSRTTAEDADGKSHDVWRLEPATPIRFDDSVASRVSLHLGADLLPVRFRATTTAVGIAVTYTQRWSQWGTRVTIFCDHCHEITDP